jgi:predicted TIM-barrel fold metal-dependent hydrolase
MFGSDFPYFAPQAELEFVRRAVGDPQPVLYDNAARAFGLIRDSEAATELDRFGEGA